MIYNHVIRCLEDHFPFQSGSSESFSLMMCFFTAISSGVFFLTDLNPHLHVKLMSYLTWMQIDQFLTSSSVIMLLWTHLSQMLSSRCWSSFNPQSIWLHTWPKLCWFCVGYFVGNMTEMDTDECNLIPSCFRHHGGPQGVCYSRESAWSADLAHWEHGPQTCSQEPVWKLLHRRCLPPAVHNNCTILLHPYVAGWVALLSFGPDVFVGKSLETWGVINVTVVWGNAAINDQLSKILTLPHLLRHVRGLLSSWWTYESLF